MLNGVFCFFTMARDVGDVGGLDVSWTGALAAGPTVTKPVPAAAAAAAAAHGAWPDRDSLCLTCA